MSENPWKDALRKVRLSVRKGGEASCTGQASDTERGWVNGHNDAYAHILSEIDDAISDALDAEDPTP